MKHNAEILYLMNKKKAANAAVKLRITNALFELMKEKDISDITITELIKRAGVARASFYRNYSSKEDILIVLIHHAFQSFLDGRTAEEIDFKNFENVVRGFECFKKYGTYVLGLYRSNYATVLLEELNQFHAEITGTMPASSMDRYAINVYMGALFNTAIAWLNGGAKESCEDMAKFFMERINII